MGGSAARGEDDLVDLFRRLPVRKRRSLLEFAAFLAAGEAPAAALQTRSGAVRPPGESVVHAIRRLVRAHPELDRAKLMSATSRCLAAHMVDGREAAEVIDELEALFARERARAADGGAGAP